MDDNLSFCVIDCVAYSDIYLQDTRERREGSSPCSCLHICLSICICIICLYLSLYLSLYLYLYHMSVFVSVFLSVFASHKGWCMVAGTCDLVTGELVSEQPRVIYRATLKSNLSSYCASLLLLLLIIYIIYHL